MVRPLQGTAAPLTALAFLAVFAGRGDAQYWVPPAPVATYYPAPVVTWTPRVAYYAPVVTYAPPVAYYPSTTVTTYRYGAILPRRRVTVTTYSTPAYYAPVYPAP